MTVPAEHFEQLYAGGYDPWGFEDRWYEERKRAMTLAALPDPFYGTAYEPGCSIGVLTAALAERCGSLLASDGSALALARAKARLADRRNVRLEQRVLPHGWPAGSFDLVLLSEILYYFTARDLRDVVHRAVAAVAPGGALVSVHWRHEAPDHPQRGWAVGQALASGAAGLVKTVSHVEDDFDLAVYVRPHAGEPRDRLSVAARTGLC